MNYIHYTSDINSTLQDVINENAYTSIGILVDDNTKKYCLPHLNIKSDLIIEISSGEENKTLSTCAYIWQELTDAQFDRNSLLINLGGGVIGDMGGFCAATYKRGINFINIPTTLLAQVDASIGGKLGIDFNGFKNHIGLFQNPSKVLIDTIFLDSLPVNELRSGFAEVIKHHLIIDQSGWRKLITCDWTSHDWFEIVEHSTALKSKIVDHDPTEKGLRKLLNFGHTIGHAVESYYLNTSNKLLHGEAIAIGMIAEAFISCKNGLLPENQLDEITDFIRNIYHPMHINDVGAICSLISQDKKNKGGKTLCVFLKNVGEASWDNEISKTDIEQSFQYLNQT